MLNNYQFLNMLIDTAKNFSNNVPVSTLTSVGNDHFPTPSKTAAYF